MDQPTNRVSSAWSVSRTEELKTLLTPQKSSLVLIDFQQKLVPAIAHGNAAVGNARRLLAAADLLDVPVLVTEQNAAKLGPTVPELASGHPVLHKLCFDAACAEGFDAALGRRPDVVIAGVEAHVCVLQTALGLLERDRRVYVVEDAIGSRAPASKVAALRRMERHGVEIVTTEMMVFEWLGTAEHPRFREAMALVK